MIRNRRGFREIMNMERMRDRLRQAKTETLREIKIAYPGICGESKEEEGEEEPDSGPEDEGRKDLEYCDECQYNLLMCECKVPRSKYRTTKEYNERCDSDKAHADTRYHCKRWLERQEKGSSEIDCYFCFDVDLNLHPRKNPSYYDCKL